MDEKKKTGSLRINRDRSAAPGNDRHLDRMQRVIDQINNPDQADQGDQVPPQVIKINLEIPLTNATKYLTSIRDFLSALIPKGKDDGPN